MPYIAIRDPLAEAKDTLSSWDKCMAKSYCKWPVIVVIIVGVLVILSTAFCIYQCGKCATCCCCCNCCSCCRSSGGGGDGGGHKRMKSGEPYPMPAQGYNQGYNQGPIAPPVINSRPVQQQYRSHPVPAFTPAEPERPQYAKFESPSKPVNEDALPAMPSWSEAKSTRVEETVIPEKRGDLEMDRLDHNGSMTSAAAIGHARRSPGPSPIQRSPTHDNYGFPPDYQNDSFVSAAPQRNHPGAYGNQYHQHEDDYRGVTPVSSISPVNGYGRRSPHEGYGQQYSQPGLRQSPGPSYGYDAPEYNNNYSTPTNARNYDGPAYPNEPVEMPSPVVNRTHSPQYAPSGSTRYEPVELPSPVSAHHPQQQSAPYEAPGSSTYGHPAALYPGKQTYAPEPSYSSQPSYQAYQPQETGVMRKPVQGSWKEV